MRRPVGRIGFTLVELLVVITIIVVLLALLTPAMDQAIYQAELAVCATTLKGIATGAQTYAAGSRRFYPARAASNASAYNLKVSAWDYRPALRSVLSVNASLNDRFAPRRMDLDQSKATSVSSSYLLWFGYQYVGEQGMKRLGDRWTYAINGTTQRSTFSVLATDTLANNLATAVTYHQDLSNSMGGGDTVDDASYTYSRWWLAGGGNLIPPLYYDMNAAFDDGSVRTLAKVTIDRKDNRLAEAGLYADKTNDATGWFFVPPDSP